MIQTNLKQVDSDVESRSSAPRIPAQFRRTAKTASGKASIELWQESDARNREIARKFETPYVTQETVHK